MRQMTLIPTGGSKLGAHVWKRDKGRWSRSRRSLFHRLVTGVKKARFLRKQVWFITLTTSELMSDLIRWTGVCSRDVFKRHFSSLIKRCRRKFGRFEYCTVHTDEGYGVYHLLVNSYRS